MINYRKSSIRTYAAPRETPEPKNGFNYRTYEVLVNVADMPLDIPTSPNPRDPKVTGKIYRQIIDSLESNDGLFHKKNKGITIVATHTRYSNNQLILEFATDMDNLHSSDGILDGGHTYQIIKEMKHKWTSHAACNNQYVKLTIIVGLSYDLIPDIASALNNSTSLSVSTKENHKGSYDWIKDSLANQSYADDISYYENQNGTIQVESLIQIMTLLNIIEYPLINTAKHPIIGYSGKAACVNAYSKNILTYKKFNKILPQILELHDLIQQTIGSSIHGSSNLCQMLNSPETTRFAKIPIAKKLESSALMPILSAFRSRIVEKNEQFQWKQSFEKTKEILMEKQGELRDDMLNVYREVSDLNRLGKSPLLWSSASKTLKSA